jgi:hypothetical protein
MWWCEYRKQHSQSYGFIHGCLTYSWLHLTKYDAKKKECSETFLSCIKDFIKIYFTIKTHFSTTSKKIARQMNTQLKEALWKIVEVICLLMKWTHSARETSKSYFKDLNTRSVRLIFFYKRKNQKNYGFNTPYTIWYKLLLNYTYFKEVSIQDMIFWSVKPFRIVNGYQCFGGKFCLHFKVILSWILNEWMYEGLAIIIPPLHCDLQWSIVLPLLINHLLILHFEWNIGLCLWERHNSHLVP